MEGERFLLVDGDILLYRFAHSNEFTVQWDEEVSSQVMNKENAINEMIKFIAHLVEVTKATDMWIVFSGPNNFRYKVLPTYKHNRVGIVKPELHAVLKHYLEQNYATKEKEGLEGDDTLGIMATIQCPQDRELTPIIIASIDKDLKQIPGYHHNWNTDETFTVSPEEADFNFFMQILTGDPTDGYTGLPGVGPVKARRLLADVQDRRDYWPRIVQAYQEKGLTEEDALVQARVARILRAEDYDFKKKEVKLWAP